MFEISVKEKSGKQVVSVRELYKELGLKGNDFKRWFQSNVVEVGFGMNQDFFPFMGKTKGRPRQDYLVTLDTAKHISLMSKTEKGKQIRTYFISIHDAYINGQIKQLETEATERINYLEKAIDQRDVYISTVLNEASKIMPKDPIGTESKKTGRPRLNLRRACYVSVKKDDPKQLVFGFDINN